MSSIFVIDRLGSWLSNVLALNLLVHQLLLNFFSVYLKFNVYSTEVLLLSLLCINLDDGN